jgi:type VI protein secretion system component VasF
MNQRDEENVEQLLRETRTRLQRLEETEQLRIEAFSRARKTLERIRKRRNRGGVPMWEAAQRAALRIVVLALGCVLLITGANTLDATFGGAAIVASFAVLLVEGLR